jgi:hypothetical protein
MHQNSRVLLIAALAVWAFPAAAWAGGCVANPMAVQVNVERQYPNLLRAIYDLALRSKICFAIEVLSKAIVDRPVHQTFGSGAAGAILKEWIHQLPEYCLTQRGALVSLQPCARQQRTWLDQRILSLDMKRTFVQSMSFGLYMTLRSEVVHQRAFAGSFPSGLLDDLIGPYRLRNLTVRELLDRFILDSSGSLWITTQPYLRCVPRAVLPPGCSYSPGRFWEIREYADPHAGRFVEFDERAIREQFP